MGSDTLYNFLVKTGLVIFIMFFVLLYFLVALELDFLGDQFVGEDLHDLPHEFSDKLNMSIRCLFRGISRQLLDRLHAVQVVELLDQQTGHLKDLYADLQDMGQRLALLGWDLVYRGDAPASPGAVISWPGPETATVLSCQNLASPGRSSP